MWPWDRRYVERKEEAGRGKGKSVVVEGRMEMGWWRYGKEWENETVLKRDAGGNGREREDKERKGKGVAMEGKNE